MQYKLQVIIFSSTDMLTHQFMGRLLLVTSPQEVNLYEPMKSCTQSTIFQDALSIIYSYDE